MTTPYLTIDLDKIEHNTRCIVELCKTQGIKVTGVTKATCGHPEVAKAMLNGGVMSIADSRFENIERMKNAGVAAEFMLLRLPPLSAVEQTVSTVNISLNSELTVLEGLSRAAAKQGQQHRVIIMVDLGDLREGLQPEDLMPFLKEATKLPHIQIVGLGSNLACLAGVIPNEGNMDQLVSLAEEAEQLFKLSLTYLSGCNSSALKLIASGHMPKRINHARIGEAILLGRETIYRRAWPNTYQDAFTLHAEILELKDKPSQPSGERSQDAFGRLTEFVDDGTICRALLNIGREDTDISGITPLDPSIKILTASSGYLSIDISNASHQFRVGEALTFSVNYSALLAAMTSEYVKKHCV